MWFTTGNNTPMHMHSLYGSSSTPPPILFKALIPWPTLPPFLKSLFPFPSFLFYPLLRYFRQSPPTLMQLPPALIWHTTFPLGEGVNEKPIWRGELPKKVGFGQFADLRGGGGLGKKEGGVFLRGGVETLMHTMQSSTVIYKCKNNKPWKN